MFLDVKYSWVVCPSRFRADMFLLITCLSDAGEVIFERGEEVADHGHAPRPTQKPLPRQAAHVGDVGVVDREPKDPGGVLGGGAQTDSRQLGQ